MSLFSFFYSDRFVPGMRPDKPPKNGVSRWWRVLTHNFGAFWLAGTLALLGLLPWLLGLYFAIETHTLLYLLAACVGGGLLAGPFFAALAENHCKDVCMESTGKYWIPVYNILEATCTVILAHPKYVKAVRGKKTDKKDARWIADIFKHDLVSGSFIPPADIRQLRKLMRYDWKLTNFTTGEKNRTQ